jgi:uncharacterized membrane protein
MNDRALRTALIISLLINAFLAAATAAGGVYISTVLGERASLRQQHTPLAVIARELDPSVRAQLKANMRSVALSAAPDFQEAHAARRAAGDLASAPTFDAAAVEAQLAKARAAEDRGRARLEQGFVEFLKAQPQPTRATLAKVLAGRGSFRMGPHPGDPGHGHGGPPPPEAGGPPPPPER